MRVAGPRVPEKPSSNTDEGSDHRDRQTSLGDWDAVIALCAALVLGVLVHAGHHAEEEAGEKRELDESALGVGEVVVGLIDLRDGLDAGVDDAEAEGAPEGEGRDHGLGDEHVKGTNQGRVE